MDFVADWYGEHCSQTRRYLRELATIEGFTLDGIDAILASAAMGYFELEETDFDSFWANFALDNPEEIYMKIRFVVESAREDIVTHDFGMAGGELWTATDLQRMFISYLPARV